MIFLFPALYLEFRRHAKDSGLHGNKNLLVFIITSLSISSIRYRRMAIKKQTLIKKILIIVIVLAALLTSAWFFVSYQLSHLENFKGKISSAASKALQRDFSYEKGQAALIFPSAINMQLTNIVIREKDKSADFLKIPAVSFRLDIFPLLRNRIILREVVLNQPKLLFKRNHSGALNIADFLAGEKKKYEIELRKITIEKGLITFVDQATGAKELITSFTDLSCRLDTPRQSKKSSFHITSIISEGKNRGSLALTGTFQRASRSKSLMESTVDASLRLKGTDINHYHPYLKHIPIKQLAGYLDIETAFSGSLLNFQSKGTIIVKNCLLDYPKIFRSPLQPKIVHVGYNLRRNKSELKLDIEHLAIDNLTAAGNFSVRDMGKADPVFAASAVTSTLPLRNARPYIPWGIIPKNVGSFIEDHIKDGHFRLIDGRLNGLKSQIVGMERPKNAGVLFIRAEVNKGIFVINKETPVFQNISGTLALKNRQFSLRNMKGQFGSSPCTLDGNISDFALPQPNVYDAEMVLRPARKEILWLAGKEKFRNFNFQGASVLKLFGKGPADNFRIDANWDLTDARYSYPEVMEKPQGKANMLTCDFVVNNDAVTVSSFRYDLPEIKVSGSASYSFAGENPLSFKVISNEFDLRKTLITLPFLKPYDPAGAIQINIAGRGNLNDPKSFSLKGNVSLADVSVKLPQNIEPIRGLTGQIAFGEKQAQTSQLKARIGKSAVTGKCALDNFSNPQVACQFASPLFHTADVGLQSPEKPVNFRNVKGQITVSDNLIQVNGLDLQLGESRFNLSGNIRGFAEPKIAIFLNSPHIDSDDITRLTALKYPKTRKESFPKMELDATVQVDAGKFQSVDFNNLNSRLNFTRETLNVEKFETDFFDGRISSKGKVALRSGGQNHYDARFSVDKLSLDKIQNFLQRETQIITGTLSLTGIVTASGRNTDDLQKTAKGQFQVRAGKGVLEKFSVLSKIFSLLNVVQLAKFHLPEMAKGGMPYNTITGDLSLADGIISSENFFIDSDAMQISAAGKVDLQKKEFDNIVGVHPLRTLDKIVARIPVAGWLLTDKKGNLITVHFKVDGEWGNPNVTPIPVQSVAKGTLDIFRRLFKLPEKLVTDTGEVILGH